jgi:type IV secretory pathway VirB2 component (pilin)
MNIAFKAALLLTYALGLASLAGQLPAELSFFWTLTWVLLLAHALEAAVMLKLLKRYRGPLAISVGLTLLYGFIHWAPLRKLPRA